MLGKKNGFNKEKKKKTTRGKLGGPRYPYSKKETGD